MAYLNDQSTTTTMRTYQLIAPVILLVALGCADSHPRYLADEAALEGGRPASAATEAVVGRGSVDATAEGWMSSTCTTMLASDQLWGALQTGYYDLYVISDLEIIGDEEFQEDTGTGILESRALRISLKNADRVFSMTGSNADEALLFLEESRVFYSNEGTVYREQACHRAASVEEDGSLSSRVLAGNSRTVVLLVQSTSQLGSVIRDVALVVGDSVRLAEGQEALLSSIEETASLNRTARSASPD